METKFMRDFYRRSKRVKFDSIGARCLLDIFADKENRSKEILIISPREEDIKSIFISIKETLKEYPELEGQLKKDVSKPYYKLWFNNYFTAIRGIFTKESKSPFLCGRDADVIYIIDAKELGEDFLAEAILPIIYTVENIKIYDSEAKKSFGCHPFGGIVSRIDGNV